FPAGLVPRFEAALAGAGYHVSVADRRPPGLTTRIDTELLRDRGGEEGELLRAVVREPLGQVEFNRWDDMVWRVAHLCAVFPEARTLIAGDFSRLDWDLYCELAN